jgi:hypothetical protein
MRGLRIAYTVLGVLRVLRDHCLHAVISVSCRLVFLNGPIVLWTFANALQK